MKCLAKFFLAVTLLLTSSQKYFAQSNCYESSSTFNYFRICANIESVSPKQLAAGCTLDINVSIFFRDLGGNKSTRNFWIGATAQNPDNLKDLIENSFEDKKVSVQGSPAGSESWQNFHRQLTVPGDRPLNSFEGTYNMKVGIWTDADGGFGTKLIPKDNSQPLIK